jgi:hypothetical protein
MYNVMFACVCTCQHDGRKWSCKCFFFPVPPHVHIDFVVSPPRCGRSVTDFWVHRAQLRCLDDVSDKYEREGPEGALNLNSTGYPDHDRYGDLPLQGKIPTTWPGIEPGTSWLVVRSSEHQATRMVEVVNINQVILTFKEIRTDRFLSHSSQFHYSLASWLLTYVSWN